MRRLASENAVSPTIAPIPQKLMLIDERNRLFLEGRARFIALPTAAMAAAVLLLALTLGAAVLLMVDENNRQGFIREAVQVTADVVDRRTESYGCGENRQLICENHFMSVRYQIAGGEAITREIRVRDATYRSWPSQLNLYYNPANSEEIFIDGELNQGVNVLSAVTGVGAIFVLIIGGIAVYRTYHAVRYSQRGNLHYVQVESLAVEKFKSADNQTGYAYMVRFTLPAQETRKQDVGAKLYNNFAKRRDLTEHSLAVIFLGEQDFKIL